MDWSLGLVGLSTVTSAGSVGKSGLAVRVFDVAMANTSGPCSIQLFNGTAVGNPYLYFPSNIYTLHSAVGFRFPDGCYVVATGCTAAVSFINEF